MKPKQKYTEKQTQQERNKQKLNDNNCTAKQQNEAKFTTQINSTHNSQNETKQN